jgi:hypothetical protein
MFAQADIGERSADERSTGCSRLCDQQVAQLTHDVALGIATEDSPSKRLS